MHLGAATPRLLTLTSEPKVQNNIIGPISQQQQGGSAVAMTTAGCPHQGRRKSGVGNRSWGEMLIPVFFTFGAARFDGSV